MDEKPSQREMVDKVGISQPYASLILAGKRMPPKPLAIHIYRQTGWRHDSIADLTDNDFELLERISPWQAPVGQAA